MYKSWKKQAFVFSALFVTACGVPASPAAASAPAAYDNNDFLITDYQTGRIAIYDENLVFKSYLDSAIPGVTGLDMRLNNDTVASSQGDFNGPSTIPEVRLYHSDATSAGGFAGYLVGNPVDVKAGSNNLLYVAVQGAGVAEFDLAGNLQRTFGTNDLSGAALLPNGVLWAAKSYQGSIENYSLASGDPTTTFAYDNGQVGGGSLFYSVTTNTVLMADKYSYGVYERDVDGGFIRKFDWPGAATQGVTRGPNGYVYATDFNNDDLYVWKPDGTLIGTTLLSAHVHEPVGIIWTGNITTPLVANDDNITIPEDNGPTTFDILANDGALGGATINIVSATAPSHGTIQGTIDGVPDANGPWNGGTYQSDPDYNGPDSFTYTISDGAHTATATVNITITSTMDSPVAYAQSVTTHENTAKAITLTATDADAGDVLTYGVVTGPAHGTLSGAAPNLTYTPANNYSGPDSFTYKANDGVNESNTATISITVSPVNQRPTVTGQTVSTNEDTAKSITLIASDADGDPLTYTVVTPPAHGAFISSSGSSRIYMPAANYFGHDSFTYKVNDGALDSSTTVVNINIGSVNDAPVADAQSVSTNRNAAKPITLTGSDVEGSPLTYNVAVPPAHGTLSGSGANRTYTPTANYTGADSFTFKVNDGMLNSAVATVSITVKPFNTRPTVTPQTVKVNQDTVLPITLIANDADNDPLTYTVVTAPAHGMRSGAAPNVNYTPDAGYFGSDHFTFKVNDGYVDSTTTVININIKSTNVPPVVTNRAVSTDEDTALPITLAGSDANGDALTFSEVSNPAHGTLSGSGANLTYTPDANYNGRDSFLYKANDGKVDGKAATVTITVVAVNDAPVANDQSVSTSVNTPLSITFTGSDVEGTTLHWTVLTNAAHGSLSGSGATRTYKPATGYTGPDSFTVRADDAVNSNTATISITVSP